VVEGAVRKKLIKVALPRVGGKKEGVETEGHLGLKAKSRWGENETHLAPTLAEKRSAPEGAPGQRSYRRRGAISFVAFSFQCNKRGLADSGRAGWNR
jgi:hypothetical protein